MVGAQTFRRAGRRTNLAVLVLLVAALATGALVFASGTPLPARVATVAHGVAGLALVALVPWKRAIVRRARRLQASGLALTGLILLCLGSGFVEEFAGYRTLAGISPIQVHVGSALLAVPLLVWHMLRHRRQRLRRADLSRRQLLRTAGLLAGASGSYAALSAGRGWAAAPAARRAATGSRPLAVADAPGTSWLLDRVPESDPGHDAVQIAGRAVRVADLQQRGRPVRARLDCTSGWYADATWTGVPLVDLVGPGPRLRGRSVLVRSVTGYSRLFPLADLPDLWLVTHCEGEVLRPETGAPVRLVAPGRRGFWWVKWVAAVEVSVRPAWAQPPFPVQ